MKDKEQDKRDRLVAEWILRIASLERLLLNKGIITDNELSECLTKSVAQFGEIIKAMEAQKSNKEDN